LISAWILTGNEALIVEKIEEGHFLGFISPQILIELKRALHYPKFKLTNEDVDAACNYYSLLITPVQPAKSVQVIKEDKDDNKFLDCALEASADFSREGGGRTRPPRLA